ncbi:MAG TPA: hypothetical protein ENN84_07510 [Candidatus Marinimicrobia bacterium]|nr:hypothetical protein [Candidatus Neomarinimicrobiota bacterium]
MLNGLSNVFHIVPLAEMAKDMKREQVREQHIEAKNSSKFVARSNEQEASREAMRERSDEEELLRRLEAKRQQMEISERQKRQKQQQNRQNPESEEVPNDEKKITADENINQNDSAISGPLPFYRSQRFQKQAVNAYTYIDKHRVLPPEPQNDLTI